MIEEVDETLRALMRDEALKGSQVDVSFDAPTKDWAARRNAPTVNLYLYDIREDLSRRDSSWAAIRSSAGIVTGHGAPPRHFKLQYMLTAWTQRPEDEHRLLSACLATLLRHETLSPAQMAGSLAEQPLPGMVTAGLPLGPDRSIADVWSALGGELKPSLDVVVTVPFVVGQSVAAGAPVTEAPRISFSRPAVGGASASGAGAGGAAAGAGGVAGEPGMGDAAGATRGKKGKGSGAVGAVGAVGSADSAGSAGPATPGGASVTELAPRRTGSGMSRRGPIRPDEPAVQDETLAGGTEGGSGRIIRVRGFPRP